MRSNAYRIVGLKNIPLTRFRQGDGGDIRWMIEFNVQSSLCELYLTPSN